MPCGATTAAALCGGAPIVVLAPHPDDESLGCGALLAAAFAADGAHVVCLTDGGGSHPGSRRWSAARLGRRRARELGEAIARLGGGERDLTRLGVADGRLSAEGAAAERLADVVVGHCRRLGARSLFATFALDNHADHKATAAIAYAVAARLPALRLLFYPVWSRQDDPAGLMAQPGWRCHRLPPGALAARKRHAIMAHASQLGGVVDDDADGFVLPPAMVERFVEEDELYLEPDVAFGADAS